jgi:hypothetical protein
MTMTLIETKTLGTAAASIVLSAIPQTFTDILIVFSGRTTSNIGGEQWAFGNLGINADGLGVNQTGMMLQGRSTAAGESYTGAPRFFSPSSASTSNTFGNNAIYISNYTGSNPKSISIDGVSEDNSSGGAITIFSAGLWSGTAAITSVTLFPRASTGDFAIGSIVSIYGILKGSSGGVVVS